MKTRIANDDKAAEQLIPPAAPDGSGIGVNYVDAYIKPLNTEIDDGPPISCQRKGLKITLTIGEQTGEAIMRRIDHGPDVREILRQALKTAAADAGSELTVEAGAVFLDL